jgi:hypothetical protein
MKIPLIPVDFLRATALLCFFGAIPAVASGQEPARQPVLQHFVRTLGPFRIEAQTFTVELSMVCYKPAKNSRECPQLEDEANETVQSYRVLDAKGQAVFSRKLKLPLDPSKGLPAEPGTTENDTLVESASAVALEGRDHQALEILTLTSPRVPYDGPVHEEGPDYQIFALRDGTLQPMNPEPFHVSDSISELPPGATQNSRRLLPGNTFQVHEWLFYFTILRTVTLDWKAFLVEESCCEYALEDVHQHDIQSDGSVRLFPAPDAKAKPVTIDVSRDTGVRFLSAHIPDQPNSTCPGDCFYDSVWLRVRINGKPGWIHGTRDFEALGLYEED